MEYCTISHPQFHRTTNKNSRIKLVRVRTKSSNNLDIPILWILSSWEMIWEIAKSLALVDVQSSVSKVNELFDIGLFQIDYLTRCSFCVVISQRNICSDKKEVHVKQFIHFRNTGAVHVYYFLNSKLLNSTKYLSVFLKWMNCLT